MPRQCSENNMPQLFCPLWQKWHHLSSHFHLSRRVFICQRHLPDILGPSISSYRIRIGKSQLWDSRISSFTSPYLLYWCRCQHTEYKWVYLLYLTWYRTTGRYFRPLVGFLHFQWEQAQCAWIQHCMSGNLHKSQVKLFRQLTSHFSIESLEIVLWTLLAVTTGRTESSSSTLAQTLPLKQSQSTRKSLASTLCVLMHAVFIVISGTQSLKRVYRI